MLIEQISVLHYRNIASAQFFPAEELTVICGKNGQGKTNLLESVWMLTGGKSFRGSKDSELVQENEPFALVEGTVRRAEDTKRIHIAVAGDHQEKKGRFAKLNGVDYGRATHLAGVFTAVVFDPNHLSLIKGSPEGRRRFLDAALCQLYPQYLSLLRQYSRCLTQKNALLKAYWKTADSEQLLDVFDTKLAQTGEQISQRRKRYLAQIAPEAVRHYSEIASGCETLALRYEPSWDTETLREAIQAARKKDLAAGFCTVGPHRDDFAVWIDEKQARTFASQGQQRSAVLSLKLAEAAGVQMVTGEHPVMLLDDVLSELDDTRQTYLLNRMACRQTIVTACNAELFSKTNGKIYTMSAGKLTER